MRGKNSRQNARTKKISSLKMSTNGSETSSSWKDKTQIYPPCEEIAITLQDKGRKKKAKKGNHDLHCYPLIEKLSAKVYNAILKHFNNPDGLTKNVSRGKLRLAKEIIHQRKLIDQSELHIFFHKYAVNGQVFTLTNSTVDCGLSVVIEQFQETVTIDVAKRNIARTNMDGLRLSLILLDPQYRGSVSRIMTKKKNRIEADIAGDPVLHFFESILPEAFMNKDYMCSAPTTRLFIDLPEEERDDWDPNEESIWEHDRDAMWLCGTCDDYICPKYKKELDKWNKLTGGGSGDPALFINYCGTDTWLAWVFVVDMKANFLLAQNAGGRMPRHLQMESGFADDVSSLGETSGGCASTAVETKLEQELAATKEDRKRLGETLGQVAEYLGRKNKAASPQDAKIAKVEKYSSMLTNQAVLDSMSPDSKTKYCDAIRRKRKKVLDDMTADGTP